MVSEPVTKRCEALVSEPVTKRCESLVSEPVTKWCEALVSKLVTKRCDALVSELVTKWCEALIGVVIGGLELLQIVFVIVFLYVPEVIHINFSQYSNLHFLSCSLCASRLSVCCYAILTLVPLNLEECVRCCAILTLVLHFLSPVLYVHLD